MIIPQIINDITEVYALPEGTVIRDGRLGMGPYRIYVKDSEGGWDEHVWMQAGNDCHTTLDIHNLPVTVLGVAE